jgi:luciferase family oxidoreductase group 1
MGVPLSVLDLSPVVSGSTATQALRDSIELAKAAESFGYRRYWFAEHHFAAVASTSPDVLAGQALARTERINVGSAAVLLGYYPAPLVVERFAILAALYPGRVDFGLGRAAQSVRERELPDVRVAREAQLFLPGSVAQHYGDQVKEVLDLLAGTRTTPEGLPVRIGAAEESGLTPWVFGSSRGQSASVAGANGLPYVTSYHVTPNTAVDGAAAYREAFVPSPSLAEPYLVVSADAVVAPTDEQARELAEGYGRWAHSIRALGTAEPYPAPGQSSPLTAAEHAIVADRISTQLVGSPQAVAERLQALVALTKADEAVVTTITHDFQDRVRSYELLAKAWT